MDIGIKLIGHERIYELENIVRATFKGVKIVFDIDCENMVISELKEREVITTIRLGNTEYVGISSFNPDKPYLNKLGLIINLSYVDAYKKYTPFNLAWGILIGIRPQKKVSQLKEFGYSEDQIKDILINDFLISEKRADLMIKADGFEEEIEKGKMKNGVSLYIGIPFCKTRCAYCSFISKPLLDDKELQVYLENLCKEIETAKNIKNIETVYIGGGTPTVLNENQLSKLLYTINNTLDLSKIREFSVEAGRPDSINKEKLKILKDMGVDRISINPQTLNDKTLREIKRNHTKEDFFAALNLAKETGFKTINCDLIAGLYKESIDDFKYSLDKIYSLNPENITVHTLSIKRSADYTENEATNNIARLMQDYTFEKLKDYIPYYIYRQKNTLDGLENTGYCKKGHECLYNVYMMREVQSIIAFGGGSVSKAILKDEIVRLRNPKDSVEYIRNINKIITKKEEFLNEYFNC